MDIMIGFCLVLRCIDSKLLCWNYSKMNFSETPDILNILDWVNTLQRQTVSDSIHF